MTPRAMIGALFEMLIEWLEGRFDRLLEWLRIKPLKALMLFLLWIAVVGGLVALGNVVQKPVNGGSACSGTSVAMECDP